MTVNLPPTRPHQGSAEIAQGIAAVVALVAILVGMPVLLAASVGWPLPHALPSVGELREHLVSGTIPDGFFPRALATLAWLYWAHLLMCVAVEVLAVARGRLPGRILTGGLNQALASRLVAAVLLLLPSGGAVRPAMLAAPPATVAGIAMAPAADDFVETDDQRPNDEGSAITAAPSESRIEQVAATPEGVDDDLAGLGSDAEDFTAADGEAAPGLPGPSRRGEPGPAAPSHEEPIPRFHVVEAGDTLWGIAEQHLGDGLRWREIFERNQGTTQPDGRRLEHGDRIYPGWRLELPIAATRRDRDPADDGAPAASGPDGTTADLTAPGTSEDGGGTFSGRAAGRSANGSKTGIPEDRTEHPSTSADGPGTAGQGRVAPSEPQPDGAAGSRPSAAAPTSATQEPAPDSRDTPADVVDPEASSVRMLALVGGLLAAGAVAAVTQLRRRQWRRRPAGRRIRLPEADALTAEQTLRNAEEPTAADQLDRALRLLADRLDGQPAPAVRGLVHSGRGLELLLAEPASSAPAPFHAADQGCRWTLDHTPEEPGSDQVVPFPALVTIGEDVMLNLEDAGLTALDGPTEQTRPLLDAIAVELATSTWSGHYDLVLVGLGQELTLLERVRVLPDIDAILPELQTQSFTRAERLAQLGHPSATAARAAGDLPDHWTPTVILLATPPPDTTLEQLARLTANPASAICAVIAGAIPDPPARVTLTAGAAMIEPLGITVTAQQLRPNDYRAVVELLHTAADTTSITPATPPYDQVADSRAPTTPQITVVADPQPEPPPEPSEVEIRVLGRIGLHGRPRISRSKSMELLVYLALHPRGVDPDRVWEALWPGKPLNRGTLHTTVAVARSHLGLGTNGQRLLPEAREGLYRLDPAVGTDWHRFQQLTTEAKRLGTAGIDQLTQALQLIRGAPFDTTTPRSYEWALVHRVEVAAAVGDTAEHLATLHLNTGNHRQATWAARQGLLADPYSERLYRILMRAAHSAGNLTAIDQIMDELAHTMDIDGDPSDELHPDTINLYKRLRGTRRIASA